MAETQNECAISSLNIECFCSPQLRFPSGWNGFGNICWEQANFWFHKKIDEVFDLLNSRNPFAKANKAPVSPETLPYFLEKCYEISNYIFALKNEKGNFLRTGQRKAVKWAFMFSIQPIMAIVKDLLTQNHKPYEYVMTYKFSQDHIEPLFNKIQRMGGWNNNPNVLEFKYALCQMLIRNSIQPSKTGNCTSFEDLLSDSTAFLDISWKCEQIEHPVDKCQTDPKQGILKECWLKLTSNHQMIWKIIFCITLQTSLFDQCFQNLNVSNAKENYS